MKAKKFRKYEEGGSIREGRNENIDDDTRARAMEAVRRRMSGEESDATPAPKAAKKPTTKPIKNYSGFSVGERQGLNELKASKPSAPKATPTPAPSKPSAPAKSSSSGESDDMRDRPSGNPYVAGLKKYGPEIALGAASLLPLGKAVGAGVKVLRGLRGAKTATNLAEANAALRARTAAVGAKAEKEVASQAAKRDMFNASQERMKSGAGKAAEERLTGLAMNPRRKNIPLTEAEKTAAKTPGTGKPLPMSKAKSDAKFDNEKDIEFRKGGKAKCYAKGGSVTRGDGCAQRGHTRGKNR
jgi:hypothetical protein